MNVIVILLVSVGIEFSFGWDGISYRQVVLAEVVWKADCFVLKLAGNRNEDWVKV